MTTTTTAQAEASAPPARFPMRALLILSFGVLVTVTAESLPAGMMPEMSADLGVSSMQIGLLISVWALTVILTSIPLSKAVSRVDRRLVVGLSPGVFALANLATALAPSYGFAFAMRIAAAAAHGVFWAVVIVYASSLLAPSHLGRGLAIVTAGGTAATVAGLPAATLLAQAVGWRAAFVVLGGIALVIGVIVLRGMPRYVPARDVTADRVRGFWRDPSLPALAAFGASAVLIAVAQFASFTYIRPYLEVSAAIGTEWAAMLLFAYGIAGMVGVVAAGFLADRFPRSSLVAILVAFAVAFAVLTVAAGALAAVIGALLVWTSRSERSSRSCRRRSCASPPSARARSRAPASSCCSTSASRWARGWVASWAARPRPPSPPRCRRRPWSLRPCSEWWASCLPGRGSRRQLRAEPAAAPASVIAQCLLGLRPRPPGAHRTPRMSASTGFTENHRATPRPIEMKPRIVK